ncbi:MAG: hypothetical protein C0514_04070 [Candidatus Puniceispirillum sp.]|nr:hypothetical protein [Candidatus Puniceispirillum sp.]
MTDLWFFLENKTECDNKNGKTIHYLFIYTTVLTAVCIGDAALAQHLPEKVEDAACLKAWMEEMQGQLAHKDATKPIGERLEEAHNNVVRANIKIIEAKLAQKK